MNRRIFYMSDLHFEFNVFDQALTDKMVRQIKEEMKRTGFLDDPDNKAMLTLAGDILPAVTVIRNKSGVMDRANYFFDAMGELFDEVLVIPGNHEPYGTTMEECTRVLSEFYARPKYRYVPFAETYVWQGVNIFASTLWTDFNNGDPLCLMTASNVMNDYTQIRRMAKNDIISVTPQFVHGLHTGMRHVLETFLNDKTLVGPKVAVTHHAMSIRSISNRYRNVSSATDTMNYFYYSDLDNAYDTLNGHIHGHVHTKVMFSADHEDGGTCQIGANPRAYPHERNEAFQPDCYMTFAV